ncbi:MAG: NADH-quinone oxidoreductase subunit N, partial [Burkholderiales bacterium]
MTLAQVNINVAFPEIMLLVVTGCIMLIDLFGHERGRAAAKFEIPVGLLVILALLSFINLSIGSNFTGFGGMFVNDGMSRLLKGCILLSVAGLIVYSRAYLETRKLFTGEFILLLLFATLGMMIMVSANHFVLLYLGLEILALSTYTMVALNRDSATSTEAAMKYFILGALASGLLLYGMSMVYGGTGSLDVAVIAKTIEFSRANDPLITFGLVFVVAGLAFKLGVVQFHMWVPDVYQGAPTP